MFGPVRVGYGVRIRSNNELHALLNDMDVVQRINTYRLHWLGHVARMEKDAIARRVFGAGTCGSLRRKRFYLIWKDKIGVALAPTPLSGC